MKYLIVFITTLTIVSGCSNPAEQRKLEINQQLGKLEKKIIQMENEKVALKKDLEEIAIRYGSMPAISPLKPGYNPRQAAFEKETESIELQLNKLELEHLHTALNMQRLKIESEKLDHGIMLNR